MANNGQTQGMTPSLPVTAANTYNRAVDVATNALDYRMQPVRAVTYNGSRVNAPPGVRAGQVGGTDLSRYLNPHTGQVIDRTMQDMRRSNQMAINDVGASASAAGAFGGSRHGLVEAETNAGMVRNMGDVSAQLRQQGFDNAQAMAGQDIDRRFAADQFNTGNTMAARMANQASLNDAARFNAGNMTDARYRNRDARMDAHQFRLGAGRDLANLSNLGFGMSRQITGDQAAMGAQQQQLMQQLIDAGRDQYRGFTGAPQQSLATLMAALGGAPAPQTTTNSQSPGLLNIASLLMGL